jgi:hypothetical protein
VEEVAVGAGGHAGPEVLTDVGQPSRAGVSPSRSAGAAIGADHHGARRLNHDI